MEPIRPPQRHVPAPRSGAGELLPYLTAVLALMLLAVGLVRLHENGWRITISEPVDDDATATQQAKVIYACYDGQTGKLLYEQSEPCPSAAPPTPRSAMIAPAYESPSPAARSPQAPAPAYRPNPNQALLDAADARYRREVQSAQRAGDEQDRQRYAAQRAADRMAAAEARQCQMICSELSDLRSRMRSAYQARQSIDFYERQNELFKRLNQSNCRACMD